MKKLYSLLLFFYCTVAFAQTYENSWINYSQQYFKIKVWQDGIYQVGQTAMLFGGMPVSTIDHRQIQLWHNGIEQYIYISDANSNNHIDAGDYIEFYGQKNDGTFDTKMYADTTWQPNRNFSLITDTSVYFLTWTSSLVNKRMTDETATNYSSYTPADYFIKESYSEETQNYSVGNGDKDIDYTDAEGWVGTVFQSDNGNLYSYSKTISTDKIYSNGPNAELSTTVCGVNNNWHSLHINGPGVNINDAYNGFHTSRYSLSLSPVSFSSSNTFVYSVDPVYSDKCAFVNLSIKYPHTMDMESATSFKMYVPDGSGKTYLYMTNFNLSGGQPLFYDITNHKRIVVTQAGADLQALVDNDATGTPKFCYLTSTTQVQNINSISSISYVTNNPHYFNNFLNLAKDSAYIIVTHRSLWVGGADFYKAHRDSTTGNKVLLVDADELADQFAYGLQKHPLSIRNFSHYILDKWTSVHPPQGMFLIGKSISAVSTRYSPVNNAMCLVPSYGNPTSDILLTSGINGSILEPKIPVGRLCALNGTEVQNYLDKVKEYEGNQAGPPQDWMKEVLHFGGGESVQEQQLLQSYLNSFKSIIEDANYGGHVTSYFKDSSLPIVINQSDSLQAKIDRGVSLMTFFGHASGSGFDQSTDLPSEYHNYGKYPVVLANSCFAGDMHTTQRSVSENFVLEPNKAAIAFIASVGLGDAGYLDLYSTEFYKNISYNYYGQPIGKLMQEAIISMQTQHPNDAGAKNVCNEMSLNGDPLLKFNNWALPDYSILESQVYFTPDNLTTDLDTFSVNIITRNLARAVPDSFNVVVTRTLPNGVDSVYTIKRGHCYYADSLKLTMKTAGFNAAGFNNFKVAVDLDTMPSRVPEIDDYNNNSTTASVFIASHDIIPVYPYKYAIYPFNTVTLKASTANPLATMHTYKFEIDTTELTPDANNASPLYRFTTISSIGGVVTWNPNITLLDSVVYYWRVADDSIQYDPARFKWNESSFIYKSNKTGWSQKHIYQFKNDNYENVVLDSANRKFNFIQNIKALDVLTYGSPYGNGYNEVGYSLNNAPTEYNGCGGTASIMVAILDSTALTPWTDCNLNYGQTHLFYSPDCSSISSTFYNCNRNRPVNYFQFDLSSAAAMQGMKRLIDSVPNGNYILAYSWSHMAYSMCDANFLNSLNAAGFADVPLLQDNVPFIFFSRKGYPTSSSQTKIGNSPTDTLSYSTILQTVWTSGNITTELIGPSSNWKELHWRRHTIESGATKDSSSVSIYGVPPNSSNDTLLWTGVLPASYDVSLSWINAAQYPYLKLKAFMQDDSLRTPPQLDKWQIYYDEVPECALNAARTFSFYNNPLNEGDTIKMSIAVDNIGNVSMDSLDVDFYMYDNQRVRHQLQKLRLDSLRSGQTINAAVRIDTTFGYPGNTSLWVEANPYDSHHQLEQYHFNNTAEVKFTINRDKINPILDVTFDGVHILNNDIVSGKPNITIQLHDENEFLALNDSSKFKVYLKSPSSNTMTRVYFTEPQPTYGNNMRFTPAVLPKNSCRIDFNPQLLTDGVYTLDVEATDASNNESGRYDYKISFEVINKSTITEILNYPNPFSTSTRFVFTLTGNEIPTYMKIQIMTVTGRIIREITQNELGNIHIGRNITEYAWDGKDEFGDQLANGVYLYRVITNINGSSIEHRETEADKYFKKGWGKMYLMR